MANIFRVYKDSQVTTDRIRAEAAANSIVSPERVVYVFGTADDVAPNFTTGDGAITYASSLSPLVAEPVVIRLFTKTDGTPYDLSDFPLGNDIWTDLAENGIYVVSDFVRLNETTTLPTTLPAGLQVWYIDANGVETLWVGREDGNAWPAVGYKEFRFTTSIPSSGTQDVTYGYRGISNQIDITLTPSRSGTSTFNFAMSQYPTRYEIYRIDSNYQRVAGFLSFIQSNVALSLTSYGYDGSPVNPSEGSPQEFAFLVRVYP